jgi:hypothetical protein
MAFEQRKVWVWIKAIGRQKGKGLGGLGLDTAKTQACLRTNQIAGDDLDTTSPAIL